MNSSEHIQKAKPKFLKKVTTCIIVSDKICSGGGEGEQEKNPKFSSALNLIFFPQEIGFLCVIALVVMELAL